MQRMKTAALILTIVMISTNLAAFQATQVDELKNISFEKIEDQIIVRIEYPSTVPYDSFSLKNPDRLVLDFMGIRTVSAEPMIGINEIGIESVRSALNRPGVARVVFNFTDENPQYRIEESESGITITFWEKEEIAEQKEPEQIIEEPVKPPIEEKEEITPKVDKPTQAETKSEVATNEESTKKTMSVGFSAGYLTFQEEAFRESYGNGGIFYKGEFAFYLPTKIESFDIWTGVTFFQKEGQTTVTEEDLKLSISTFSLAVRYLKKYSRFTPFIGAGIDYIVYKETYPEDFIVASVGGSDLGFHGQIGTYIEALPNLSIKVHIIYRLAETTEGLVTVNLGGVEYGFGLVYRFNL